ncbi:patatin-like phospholipase family protein [bacterium]|nr:patatin-like phospholipase family protein [bacterium]
MRYRYLIMICMLISIFSARAQTEMRPRIGLVLSGGGARGLAHIGMLKMLDSLDIPVDYIAGTSMGAIIGALYATGYSGADIEHLIRNEDWIDLFTDKPPRDQLPYVERKRCGRYQLQLGFDGFKPRAPIGLINGQKILLRFGQFFQPYDYISHFDELPIPYRCVAADLNSCDPVVLDSGSLAKAVRASMSIPTAFSPVEYDDYDFIDGGILNNYPVDVAREMGAEKIIGVDVMSPHRDPEPARTIVQVLNRTLGFLGIRQWRENVKDSDLYINPRLHGYSIMDFLDERIKGIIACGDTAAQEARSQLIQFKEKYKLAKFTHSEPGHRFIVDSIRIHGLNRIPHSLFVNRLGLHKGDDFSLTWLDKRFQTICAGSEIDTIRWEVIPEHGQYAQLRIRVTESLPLGIEGVNITGQQTLPFGLIYRNIGIRPGDNLDIALLSRKIMDLYGLGYFKSIDYDLVPVEPGWKRLDIKVKEKPRRLLHLGIRWDSHYKLVLGIGVTANNVLLPGLRMEHDLSLAGYNQMTSRLYYPSRTLNLPFYPQIKFNINDTPVSIYDEQSNRLAEYRDRCISASFGFGILLSRSFNLNTFYEIQNISIKPDVAFPDPEMFPTWNDRINSININLDFDNLNDARSPTKGLAVRAMFEGSYTEFGSDISYMLGSLSMDYYFSLGRHTFRTHAFIARSGKSLPIYKSFNRGTPEQFAGYRRDQVFASSLNIIRLDYRYKITSFASFKLIGNAAFDYKIAPHFGAHYDINDLRGVGVGVQLKTLMGAIELIIAKGDKKWLKGERSWQTVAYLSVGALL